jgi:hypothetical protein
MSGKQSEFSEGLVRLFEATWFDLPTAVARQITGRGEDKALNDKSLNDAGWKVYEAWVSLANDAANRLYANPAFGAASGRAFETVLRVQRVGDALSSAFFGNLWPALGLPTQDQISSLRDEVTALRAQVANGDALRRAELAGDGPVDHPVADEGLHVVRNGTREAVRVNGNGKQRVAA